MPPTIGQGIITEVISFPLISLSLLSFPFSISAHPLSTLSFLFPCSPFLFPTLFSIPVSSLFSSVEWWGGVGYAAGFQQCLDSSFSYFLYSRKACMVFGKLRQIQPKTIFMEFIFCRFQNTTSILCFGEWRQTRTLFRWQPHSLCTLRCLWTTRAATCQQWPIELWVKLIDLLIDWLTDGLTSHSWTQNESLFTLETALSSDNLLARTEKCRCVCPRSKRKLLALSAPNSADTRESAMRALGMHWYWRQIVKGQGHRTIKRQNTNWVIDWVVKFNVPRIDTKLLIFWRRSSQLQSLG